MGGRARLLDQLVGGKKAGGVADGGKKRFLPFPKPSPCLVCLTPSETLGVHPCSHPGDGLEAGLL